MRTPTRKNAAVLPWLRGAAFFLITLLALNALPFYSATVRIALAVGCAALGVFVPAVGVLVFVIMIALPLMAGDLVLGLLFLLAGLGSIQYVGQNDANVFVIVGLAAAASAIHAEWALPIVAGYAMGPGEGGAAAFLACVVLEIAGIALGRQSIGVVTTGGTVAIVQTARVAAIKAPLTFRWLGPAVSGIDINVLMSKLARISHVALLIAQPVLWAVAAALVGSLRRSIEDTTTGLGLAAVVTAALGGASIAIGAAFGSPITASTMLAAAGISVVFVLAYAAAAEWVFPKLAPAVSERLGSVRTEDADVDELLRVIASAEEALENRHAIDATVLITDMKGFSRITQEQGTISTAKLIQKHRDLLLPVIKEHGGHGKSTGGDGLVATFSSSDDALAAAVRLQHVLKEYNANRPPARYIVIRIGVACGDIIVDRSGAPFIGDALNLAARVMGLADGGQILSTREVVDQAAKLPSPAVPHGDFVLKNISRPVAVYEILWGEGQQPRHPGAPAE